MIRPATFSNRVSRLRPLAALERADAVSRRGRRTSWGVEPPPFDRGETADAHIFGDDAPPIAAPAEPADLTAANSIEDLMEPGDDMFATPAPIAGGFVADLPSDESRERLSPTYLEEARRAARQGRRVTTADSGGKKGIGKGPLIASAVLTVCGRRRRRLHRDARQAGRTG